MITHEKPIYTLCPLEDFKLILGIDDRDDKLSRFCLMTATHTIEQYCKRRLLRRKHLEQLSFSGDLLLPLREYPIVEILTVHSVTDYKKNSEIIEPEFYELIPECGTDLDIPFEISLSSAVARMKDISTLKVIYKAGYLLAEVPADLKAACLELAAWNFNRYKSKRIGIINSEKSSSNNVSFEMSMPENVKMLLEPYRRKTI
jgi:hypothetical protein